jgi:uncharacterized protein
MLMVKTRLGVSPIAGIGLFADEDIAAGTITWRFIPGFDQLYSESQLESLPEPARTQMRTYTYKHEVTGNYVYCLDNARFMNHADDPNTKGVHEAGGIEGYDIATRDIRKGDELTCDYFTFDGTVAEKLGGS